MSGVDRSAEAGRREARERAVQLCYEAEQRDLSADDLLAEQVIEPDPYTATLVAGVGRHRAQVDGMVARLAKG